MPTLALDLPFHVYGFIDRQYLSAGMRDGWEPCVWFGLTCPRNRALGLSVLLECGAVYRELPPHAFSNSVTTPAWTVQDAQAWDCFGGSAQTLEYTYLRELPVRVIKSGDGGTYLFTIEFGEDGFSRYPGQTKCFHALQLEHGRLTFQPNNFLLWHESSFTTTDKPPTWLRRQPHTWHAEDRVRKNLHASDK